MRSLTLAGCYPPLIPMLSSSSWHPLSSINPSAATHKSPLVWKRCSLQWLFCFSYLNTQAFSYFLIIFSELNLWDVSSHHSSNGTVFWGATMTLWSTDETDFFPLPILLHLLKCRIVTTIPFESYLGHWLWRQPYTNLPSVSLTISSQSLLLFLSPFTSQIWYSLRFILTLLPSCQISSPFIYRTSRKILLCSTWPA